MQLENLRYFLDENIISSSAFLTRARGSIRCGRFTLRAAQIKINKPIIGRAERRLRRFELTPRRGGVGLGCRDSIPRVLSTGGHPSQFLFPRAVRSQPRTNGAKWRSMRSADISLFARYNRARLLVLANKRAHATRIHPAVKDANGLFSA